MQSDTGLFRKYLHLEVSLTGNHHLLLRFLVFELTVETDFNVMVVRVWDHNGCEIFAITAVACFNWADP